MTSPVLRQQLLQKKIILGQEDTINRIYYAKMQLIYAIVNYQREKKVSKQYMYNWISDGDRTR